MRERHRKYTTAVRSNLGLPFQKSLHQVDILGTSQGRGGGRWRRRCLLRGAILPSAGRALTLQPSPGLNFVSSRRGSGVPLSKPGKGPSPGGLHGARNLHCREGSAHKNKSFFRSWFIGGRQSQQMKFMPGSSILDYTTERALVENLNWGWTVVNPLRAEFQTVRRPGLYGTPSLPIL